MCNREAQENRKIFSSRSLNILHQLPRRSTPQLHYVFHHDCFVTTVTASRASAAHLCVTDPNDDPCGVEPTPGSDHHVVGWLVGWLAGWLVGWLAGWLVGWLVGWSVGLSVGRFVGSSVALSVASSVASSVGVSVGWSVGRSVGWSVGKSVGWSVGCWCVDCWQLISILTSTESRWIATR